MQRRPSRLIRATAGVAVFGALATIASMPLLRRRWFTVEVAGDSMQPALEEGDWLLVARRPPRLDGSAFGQVVVTRDRTGRLLVKRVVGLPGEVVQIEGGRVLADGRALDEPYVRGETEAAPYRALTLLERDSFYLLGDHRPASTDSRDLGGVRRSAIEGTVVARYWPRERIGRFRPPRRRFLQPDLPASR
ncbi:MAG: signal peptidase I [Dehalococcoidia bacterium]